MNDSAPVTDQPPIQPSLPLPTQPPTQKLSRRFRFTLFIFGIVLPGVLLGMSFQSHSVSGDSLWQSGELKDYLEMLLRPVAWLPFAPFIIYAATCLACWTIQPKFSERAWVRIGLYTGALLAVHFCIILLLILPWISVVALFVWPAWFGLLWVLNYYWRRQITIQHILVLTTLAALVCIVVANVGYQVLYYPLIGVMFLVAAAPILNAIAYSWAAALVANEQRLVSSSQRRAVTFSLVALFLAWLAAWRYAILVMLEEYSKLPTEQPKCYLSNAAAYGHPLLTGARRRGEVTACMRRLKFLEIVLQSALPGLHKQIRRCYDAWCPPLANLCQRHFLLATLTCIALLPVELIAELVRIALRIERERVQTIYGP